MTQNRHSKPLTLGAVYSACLCGEDALLDGAPTPCSRCTCLCAVASSRGTHNGVNSVLDGPSFESGLAVVAVSHA